jgi:hypothetical protein
MHQSGANIGKTSSKRSSFRNACRLSLTQRQGSLEGGWLAMRA